jgi:Fic family protein
MHYYFELIHPFWDGNGRVGRVIEASLLLREGFRYAPFAQARFYLEQVDRYFMLFNACRKRAAKAPEDANTDFVAFFL